MTIEERVLDVLKDTFELDNVDIDCSQSNCDKWDSIGQLNLVVDIESEFDVSLEPEEIGEMTSVQEIIRILNNKGLK